MNKGSDNNESGSYANEEVARFEDIVARYERITELCKNAQGEVQFDGLLFLVSFILTGRVDAPVHLETSMQRRRHLVDALKLDEQDAQFLLDIYEREKARRPGWFPDIQKLLAEANHLLDMHASVAAHSGTRH